MKTFILILAIGLSLISCEKDNEPSEGFPTIYNLNFDLRDGNDNLYEDGQVKISNLLTLSNGELTPYKDSEFQWGDLGKIIFNIEGEEITLLGICFSQNCNNYAPLAFASGAEGDEIGEDETWEMDKYYLLQYENEDVDTLRIYDIRTENPYNREFTFYINGAEHTAYDGENSTDYYISAQK